ncbi:GHKL domain-containing protein [Lysinibacillus pakistanensis]|uniref:GHKL domain-containing protein n=1 Tax=Lysinibacillus pakistanensis TaxID=759811 RepID=A0ABX6D8P1_9BACI|nr:GHKL domain-containing protein [Lysinibacillus pakistanensis]
MILSKYHCNWHLKLLQTKNPLLSNLWKSLSLVALLGNILSNSIEACQEWQKLNNAQGNISLQLYKRSGLYIITCKNNTVPLPRDIVDSLFGRSEITTKQGHDGFGTTIIKDVVQKYKGFLDFIYKDEIFTLKLKFPAIH